MPLSRRLKVLLFLLTVLAAAEFTFRGPMRAVYAPAALYNDSGGPYIGAKAWIKGLNPYSNDVFWTLWKDAGGSYDGNQGSMGSAMAYPLSCYVLLAPLTFLDWPTARAVSGLFLTGMILLSVWLLSGLPQLREGWRRLLFIALALALAPFHSGLHTGNFCSLAISFFLISFWASCIERPLLAGLCCALSVAVKPPIGLVMVLYYVLTRRWSAFVSCLISGFLVAAVAIGRLHMAGVSWLSSYLANNKLVLTDPINWITEVNPKRFQMVNLEVLWYAITKNEQTAYVLSLLIGGLLLLAVLLVLPKPNRRIPPALGLSAISVISLLPLYHRYYDAALLIVPLLWSVSPGPPRARLYQRLTWLLILPFYIPGAWMLERFQNAGRIPEYLTTKWWWDTLLMPHQIWALLLLALVLVTAIWDRRVSQAHDGKILRESDSSSASLMELASVQPLREI